MTDDLVSLDATAQAELVRNGQVSALELVDAAIAQIEALNPTLNAVIHERFDKARAEAAGPLPDGPFRGVPMVLKDLDGQEAGEPYHAGSAFLRAAGNNAERDTWLTERFAAMGAVVVGRTNTPELGLLPSTEPVAYGPTRNPWDTDRSPAGSSGGSAAAVASRMVAIGHAGDGGGSIRLPASVCGLVGLKPSRGRITLGPEAGEAWGGLVARGVVTRSVRDTARVLDAVHGPGLGDPYVAPPPSRPYADELETPPGRLRIAWTTQSPDPNAPTHIEVAVAVEAVAKLLEDLGHAVSNRHPGAWDDEIAAVTLTGHFLTCMGVWTASELDHLAGLVGRAPTEADVEAHTWAVAELGRSVTGVQYLTALDGLHAANREMAPFFAPADGGVDVFVTPTVPELPWQLGGFGPEPGNPLAAMLRAAAIVPFTVPFNISGQPAVSLPVGWSEQGLPIGVQFVAAPGREDVLLRLAAQLEVATPWIERRPDVS